MLLIFPSAEYRCDMTTKLKISKAKHFSTIVFHVAVPNVENGAEETHSLTTEVV